MSYSEAKKAYAAFGIDADAAIGSLKGVPVSVHCWQGDDVLGFEGAQSLSGGIQTTGNYPGRARTPEELMRDYAFALSLMPGTKRINIHASLLPRWRGAAPITRAIEAGDGHFGVTLMKMDAGLDTGPMLMQESFPLNGTETTVSLTNSVAELGADMLVRLLAQTESITITEQPQEGVTYAHKVLKEEGRMNFSLSASELERKIRAFSPFPSSFAEHNGTTVKIWEARLREDITGQPGEVVEVNKEGITIACAQGGICATVLQRSGKPKMPAQSFLQGYPITKGEFFK